MSISQVGQQNSDTLHHHYQTPSILSVNPKKNKIPQYVPTTSYFLLFERRSAVWPEILNKKCHPAKVAESKVLTRDTQWRGSEALCSGIKQRHLCRAKPLMWFCLDMKSAERQLRLRVLGGGPGTGAEKWLRQRGTFPTSLLFSF